MIPPVGVENALQVQINALGERMDAGFREIKEMLQPLERRVRDIEQREDRSQPLTQSRLDAAWRKIDEHSADLKALNETIVQLKQTNKILSWLGGLLGSAIILWVIGQLLGLIK
jgi:chromosome segregation ATPase